MPRGGKRPGSGAPKGNINALKHGLRSKAWAEPKRKYKKHPGRGGFRANLHPCLMGNDFALKHGRYSKKVTEFMENPQFKNLGLKEDTLREFIAGQLRQLRT